MRELTQSETDSVSGAQNRPWITPDGRRGTSTSPSGLTPGDLAILGRSVGEILYGPNGQPPLPAADFSGLDAPDAPNMPSFEIAINLLLEQHEANNDRAELYEGIVDMFTGMGLTDAQADAVASYYVESYGD